jgi:hypothetical protein
MFSFENKANDKDSLCKIVGGVKNGKIIYVNKYEPSQKPEENENNFNELKLTDGKFEVIPNIKKERDVCSFLGPSGVGKSYSINQFCMNYKKLFPKKFIYLFSRKTSDTSFNNSLKIDRVKIDYSLITVPIKYEEFENSCVIFDDIDGLESTTKEQKMIKAEVHNIKNQILELGRSLNITCLISSHIATKGNETKTLINESHLTFIYPSSGSPYHRLLNFYFGFTNKQIEKIKNFNSRWVCMTRTIPRALITETELMPLKNI